MTVIQENIEVTGHGTRLVSVEVDIDPEDCLAEFGVEAFLELIDVEAAKEYFGLVDGD